MTTPDQQTIDEKALLEAMFAHRDTQQLDIGNGEVSFLNPLEAMRAAIKAYLAHTSKQDADPSDFRIPTFNTTISNIQYDPGKQDERASEIPNQNAKSAENPHETAFNCQKNATRPREMVGAEFTDHEGTHVLYKDRWFTSDKLASPTSTGQPARRRAKCIYGNEDCPRCPDDDPVTDQPVVSPPFEKWADGLIGWQNLWNQIKRDNKSEATQEKVSLAEQAASNLRFTKPIIRENANPEAAQPDELSAEIAELLAADDLCNRLFDALESLRNPNSLYGQSEAYHQAWREYSAACNERHGMTQRAIKVIRQLRGLVRETFNLTPDERREAVEVMALAIKNEVRWHNCKLPPSPFNNEDEKILWRCAADYALTAFLEWWGKR